MKMILQLTSSPVKTSPLALWLSWCFSPAQNMLSRRHRNNIKSIILICPGRACMIDPWSQRCRSWNPSAPFSDTHYKLFPLTQEQQLSCPGTSEVKYSLLAPMGSRGRYGKGNKKRPRSNLIKYTLSIAGTTWLGNQCCLTSLWSRTPQDAWKVLNLRWMSISLCLDTHTYLQRYLKSF